MSNAAHSRRTCVGREEVAVQVRLDIAGRERVDPYVERRPFQRERLRQLDEAGLAGGIGGQPLGHAFPQDRSEEHTSELQSLMRISYAVFCLKKKNTNTITRQHNT